MQKNIKILAIESSCDETAAAVIGEENGQPVLLSNIVSSQIDLHAKTGGVVPEVASRAHMESIIPVITEALLQATTVCHSERSEESSSDAALDSSPFDKSSNDQINDKWEMINEKYPEAIKVLQNEIDYIAVTAGPGLIGSLLVGFNAAKTIAYALNKPIIPINHIEGHIYSAFVGEFPIPNFQFPILALTVSGGHSALTLIDGHGKYETIGETLDDAAGEAFDKVAQLLDLGYPGGPIVSKYASEFRNKHQVTNSNLQEQEIKNCPESIIFPRPILRDGTFNFSFSGLKTAVLQKVRELRRENYLNSHPEAILAEGPRPKAVRSAKFFTGVRDDMQEELSIEQKQEICAAFEDAVVDVLVTKSLRAIEKYQPKAFILAGGVAANKHLRETLKLKIENSKLKIKLYIPEIKFCGDNAAMIGTAAYCHVKRGDIKSWGQIELDSNMKL